MKLKKALITDIINLQKICIDAYSKNFFDHWNDGGLEWYLIKEFSASRIKSDLADKNTEYYFIEHELKPVGFIKIRNNSNTNWPIENGVELEKMYIIPKYKGMGIGKLALMEIITKAEERGKKNIFLGVIDSNLNAISFYKKLGFEFHSKTILNIPYFKEELKGMNRMIKELNDANRLKNNA